MSEIKVTDKRMFTPDGKLREDFQHLEGETGAAKQEPAAPAPRETPPAEPPPPAGPAGRPAGSESPSGAAGGAEAGPRLEIPGTPEGMGAPGFMDLVGVLAEPAMVYLGEVELPDGSTREDLQLARLHIDLLDVLRQKTAGRLTAQEATYLEELLYQLRLRYVQKRG